MMKKLIKYIKKYKLAILITLAFFIVGIIVLLLFINLNKSKIEIKKYKTSSYSFEYDTTWKISNEKENIVSLKHKNKSELEIETVYLEDEYKYLEIDTMFDEIVYDISLQNKEFELVSTQNGQVTKNQYDGYKLLYESKDTGVMVTVAKVADKLILFTYKADHKYFDILLDSVQSIIYSFSIAEDSFELSYKINIDTSKIKWDENELVANNLGENIEYEYASNHYLVNVSIPSNFKRTDFDSTRLYMSYQGLEEGTIYIGAYTYNKNIYQEFGEERDNKTIFYQYNGYRDGSYGYDFNEIVEEMSDGKGFIYKVDYKTKSDFGTSSTEYYYEIVHLVYEIDSSHILTIEIEARNQKIPKELIDKIQVNSYTNYSSYVKKDVKDGYFVGALKHYMDYNKDKVEIINLKLPERFEEDDRAQNMFVSRYYRYNYDKEREVSEYEVNYSTISSRSNSIENINRDYESKKSYGEYKNLTYSKDVIINGKTFSLYKGGYTDIDSMLSTGQQRTMYYVNTNVLFYDLGNDKCLTIHIKGNDREISESLLEELTNFDIEIKNV